MGVAPIWAQPAACKLLSNAMQHPFTQRTSCYALRLQNRSRTSTAATSSLDCLVGIFMMARLCFSSTRRSRCGEGRGRKKVVAAS